MDFKHSVMVMHVLLDSFIQKTLKVFFNILIPLLFNQTLLKLLLRKDFVDGTKVIDPLTLN